MGSPRKLVLAHVIPADKDGSGAAFELRKGQYIRVIGKAIVDFVAYNRNNLQEKLDQARTKTNQMKIFITKGDKIISKDNNVMLTITEDTWPWKHDLQIGMCSRKRHELVFKGEVKVDVLGLDEAQAGRRSKRWEDIPQRGCWENLAHALRPWPEIDPWDIPSPFNIFTDTKIDGETGRMWWVTHEETNPYLSAEEKATEDAILEMRAEIDLVVAASHHWNVITRIEIYDP